MDVDHRTAKLALLIGIDVYQETRWNELRGCKNDVWLMQDVLMRRFGFPRENVRLLLDAEATQQRIRAAMTELAAQVKPGTTVVFFYAGHGSQLADREDSNPTGWEQTLVPHDSGRDPTTNRDIPDSEIRAWVCALERRTPYVTLLFDCCHAGTMTRGDSLDHGAGVRGVPARARAAGDLPQGVQLAPALNRMATTTHAVDLLPRPDRYVVLSACRDEERASELTVVEGGVRRSHGAFSYHLCKELDQGGAERSYRDLFELVATRVTARFPGQHPRSEGALDRSIFGSEEHAVRSFVSVLSVSEAEVTLRGGALHGLTVGSEWSLFPVGEAPAEAAPCALVRVHSVAAGVARASILSTHRAIKLPCRAVERERADVQQRWPIEVAAELQSLRPLLVRSPWLRPALDTETARASIVRVRPGPAAKGGPNRDGAGLAARPSLATPASLAVLGRNRVPLLPLIAEDGGDATQSLLIEELERLVRCSWLCALNNPSSPLGSAVEALLLLGPRWTPGPLDGSGRFVAGDGSLVAIELRNVSLEPVHVAVLIVSADRSITQIYPPPGAPTQRIEPGRRTRVGAWQLRLPSEHVLPPGEIAAQASSIDTLKLFVTQEEVHLHPLLQGASTLDLGAPGADHPLRRRLSTVLAGERSRGSSDEETAASDWACVRLDVLITAAPR